MPASSTHVVPLLAATAVAGTLALYSLRHRDAPRARVFALAMAAVALWSFGFALNRATTDLAAKLWFTKLQQLGIMVVPPAVLVFTLQQTGRGSWLSRARLVLLSVVPAGCLVYLDGSGLQWRVVAAFGDGGALDDYYPAFAGRGACGAAQQ